MSIKEGIDVSTYQGVMDWDKAIGAGVEFAIIRAGSITYNTGQVYTDHQFENNKRETKRVLKGRRCTYWFFRPEWSANTQADYYTGLISEIEPMEIVLDGELLRFRWACDIEVGGHAATVRMFCERMRSHFPGENGLIYTNPNTWLYLLTGDKGWGDQYELWLADWTPPPWILQPWTKYTIWQYAVRNDGHQYGAQSVAIDHDQGSFEWPQAPPAEDWRFVNVNGLSIRSQPVYTDPGDPNGTLYGKGIKDRLVKVTGEAVNGYVPVEAWVWEKGLRK